MKLSIQKRGIIYISLIMSVGIFLVDLSIPLGVAAGVPYMTVVLLSLWHPSKNYTISVAILSSFLIIVGYFLSPEGGVLWMILYNRILALAVIWVTAIFTVERKKGELALRESETRNLRAQEKAHLGHWDWNVVTNEAIVSDEFLRIISQKREQFENPYSLEDFMESIHSDDKDKVQKAVNLALTNIEEYDIDFRVIMSNNTIKWVNNAGDVTFDSEDKPVRMVGTIQDITERKKIFDDLTASEFNLNKAQQMAHVGSWDLDLLTNKLNWSDEVYRIFGLAPQEFGATYEAFVETIHPDDRKMVDKAYQDAVKKNIPYEVTHRVLRPNGEVRIVRERSEEILDSTGKAIRSVGTVHDITEIEETTQILKNERNHFDKLLESIGEVVFIVNFNERVIERVNSEINSVFGYESSECIGQSTRMLCQNDEDFIKFGAVLQEAINRGDEVVHLKQTFMKKNKTTFPSEITLSFLKEAGEITHVISVIRDVSESERAERALREAKDKLEERVKERTLELEKSNRTLAENEELFSKIFQEGPLGMAIVNEKFQFVRTNETFSDMLGYSEEELKGMTFVDITYKEDKKINRDDINDLFKGKISVLQTEKRYIKENGNILWANLTASAIFSEDNKFLYAVAMIEDIGDRKTADQKIKNSLKEKEVLLKEIHHRVKNNLQVISSLLNLQTATIKDKKIVKQLMETKNRILSMSLIHENIYQSEDLSEVDVGNYVTMLSDNLQQTYSEEGKSIIINNKIEKITLDIDRAIPLGLIITELVTNAMQHAFINKTKGTIDIKLREKKNLIEMEIKDNGIGISKDIDINNIDSLGLKLVNTLSAQLTAHLSVKVANGTTYTIVFPKIEEE